MERLRSLKLPKLKLKRAREGTRREVVRARVSDAIDLLAWSIFGRISDRVAKSFNLDKAIARAGLAIHPRVYATRMLFYTLIAVLGGLVAESILILFERSLVILIAATILVTLIPIVIFAYHLLYPSLKVSSRAKSVDHELPFFAAYLTTMAYSGVSPEKVIEVAAEQRVFKGVRDEARRIIRDIRIFGKDPLSAIDSVAAQHPSSTFRDFMLGLTATARSGGDIRHYLETKTTELFRRRTEDLRILADRVGIFVQLFVSVNLVMGLAMYAFFIVSSVLPIGGFGLPMFIMFTLIVQPMLSLLILLMVDSLMPKDPIWDKTIYGYLFLSTAAAVGIGLALFIVSGGYEVLAGIAPTPRHFYAVLASIAFSLVALSIGGVRAYFIKRRVERDLSAQLANFLRDLTEVRKTGLSIEKCFQVLTSREYGVLTPIVRRVAGSISIGMDITKAVRKALRGVQNWLALIVFRFLVDAVEYGGATPIVLDNLSRFTSELTAIYDELKRRLKTYIAIPYIGAILLSTVSFMLLGMMAQVLASTIGGGIGGGQAVVGGLIVRLTITGRDLFTIALVASVGSLINSWLMGLMSGKLKDLTILSGFIHSILLAVVALASSITSFNIYILPLLTR
ncbi:MAG: type II secretion system F family protein [Desulfurococcaceae archaeon]